MRILKTGLALAVVNIEWAWGGGALGQIGGQRALAGRQVRAGRVHGNSPKFQPASMHADVAWLFRSLGDY